MSCYSCCTKFGLLKKEVGCEVCGFSFCSRCCKKHEIPSDKEKATKKIICNKCYLHLTSNKPNEKVSPPLAHKKRMAALKIRSSSVDSGCQWSDERDKDIAERLQKLKKDRIKDDVPSEDDIAERLAKLKGMDPAKFKSPPIEVYRPPNMQTVVEQATALMKQFVLEADLDSRLVKPEDEIAARLARLRDEKPPHKEPSKISSEIDTSNLQSQVLPDEEIDIDKIHSSLHEESKYLADVTFKELKELSRDEEYKKVVQNIPKEMAKTESEEEDDEANDLVEKLLASNPDVEGLDSLNDDTEESNSKSDKDTTEEFPWCVICTEDAKIRCFGCDSDLYCLSCFKECHDNFDIKGHKTCPYLPQKDPVL